MLLAGILIGVLKYIPLDWLQEALFSSQIEEVLSVMSKIGVVLIMFSAGLGTDLKKLKQTGAASVVITAFGVVVPMLLGFLVAFLFDFYTPINLSENGGGAGQFDLLSDFFYGAILTATSVSVTVAVLKELGKLDTKVGTSIIAAAVIDDVIGIIILSVLTGFSSKGGEETGWDWFHPNAGLVVIKIVVFFIAAIAIGVGLRKLFDLMERRAPHNRRVPIISLAACFLYAYCAEKHHGRVPCGYSARRHPFRNAVRRIQSRYDGLPHLLAHLLCQHRHRKHHVFQRNHPALFGVRVGVRRRRACGQTLRLCGGRKTL